MAVVFASALEKQEQQQQQQHSLLLSCCTLVDSWWGLRVIARAHAITHEPEIYIQYI